MFAIKKNNVKIVEKISHKANKEKFIKSKDIKRSMKSLQVNKKKILVNSLLIRLKGYAKI